MICFNPSQVQFTRALNFKTSPLKTSFNPSQVQFTLEAKEFQNKNKIGFQSLTGSIHTSSMPLKAVISNLVSIPHRFNSHLIRLPYNRDFAPGFQSLTGSIHTPWLYPTEGALNNCFNPSQVQFTQKLSLKRFLMATCFNPSQVQFTPVGTRTEKLMKGIVSIPHRFNSHNF